MGSLAKRLGQIISVKSFESESKNILKTSKANKVPGSLSLALDGTLKDGHDMKVFGLGTLASMADIDRYRRFTQSMYHIYSTMEDEFDQSKNSAVFNLWKNYGDTLRRSQALQNDLKDVSSRSTNHQDFDDTYPPLSPAQGPTLDYVKSIRKDGELDRSDSGGRLIAHFYCRYFADLFGGQVLAVPYNVALSLPPNTPRHYKFLNIENRREFIETLYQGINDCGNQLSKSQREEVVRVAYDAFRHNINVYAEEPIYWDSVKGGWNVCTGFGRYLVSRAMKKPTHTF